MSTFLSTSNASAINLTLLRRDYFDGLTLVLQDENNLPLDLNEVEVCASVWKRNAASSYEQVLAMNVEKQDPLEAGRIRIWLSSAQTATVWDEAYPNQNTGQSLFPNVYSIQTQAEALSSLFWDVRIESQNNRGELISVDTGAFITGTNHGLAATDRVIFKDTATSFINYNGTGARIYTNLTNISNVSPYSFTIGSLFGVTNAAIGGSVCRLKQETVVAGAVLIGTTLSNCFP